MEVTELLIALARERRMRREQGDVRENICDEAEHAGQTGCGRVTAFVVARMVVGCVG